MKVSGHRLTLSEDLQENSYMNDIIYTAASGAIINQIRLEILSNNLSNLNTAGFKADRSIFRTYLPSSSGSDTSGDMSPNFTCNYHVEFEGTKTDFSSGGLQYTGNVLDLALEGDGFFCIKTQDGTRYTRNGNFTWIIVINSISSVLLVLLNLKKFNQNVSGFSGTIQRKKVSLPGKRRYLNLWKNFLWKCCTTF